MHKQMLNTTLSGIGLVIALVALFFGYQQYNTSKTETDKNRARIFACVEKLSFHKGVYRASNGNMFSQPRFEATVKMVNLGRTQGIVSQLLFRPIGIRDDGTQGSFVGEHYVDVSRAVPGNDLVLLEGLPFESDEVFPPSRWVKEITSLKVFVLSPEGRGEPMDCRVDDTEVDCEGSSGNSQNIC